MSTPVVPSAYVPVAVNWSVPPTETVELAAVTAIDVNAALVVTVSVVEPVIVPELALMVVVPTFKVVANPVLLMVATVGSDDAQIKFFKLLEEVLPSSFVAVAVNC
jgi:hypothetical protein